MKRLEPENDKGIQNEQKDLPKDQTTKKLKLPNNNEYVVHPAIKKAEKTIIMERIADCVSPLSLEEGVILMERWEMTNYQDFAFWLKNACAQATFQIEEKVSFNSKPTKNKTVQIKNFQCHLQLKFADPDLDSLIGKNPKSFIPAQREPPKHSQTAKITFLPDSKNLMF